jgi:replicative DNA helicase
MAQQGTGPASPRADRIPPYSEEAERGVLGAALLEPSRVIDLAVEKGLSQGSFYVPAHRDLFELLGEMVREGKPADILTVCERLRALGKLDDIGGPSFIEGLVDSTPTAEHAEYYIEIVRQHHLRRRIIENAREAAEACYKGDDEADSLLNKVEQSFFGISESQRTPMTPWPQLIKGAIVEIERIATSQKGLTGIPSGFKDLDDLLMGFQPADLIIIAARPSMGKTALALNIAEYVALGAGSQQKLPVAIFSLEMSREQLVRRMICSRARVSSHKLRGGYISADLNKALINAADALTKAPIYLDDTAAMEVLELRARARRLRRKSDIQLVVVDYLQMLHYPQFAKEGRQRETAAISGALKAMAKELAVPVLVLSQLSRAPEQRSDQAKPRLSDLRDSGAIEQDADVVLMLRRPVMYDEDPEHTETRLAYLTVGKHRNGPTGEVQLNFDAEYTRFESRKREHGVDEPHAPAGPGGF